MKLKSMVITTIIATMLMCASFTTVHAANVKLNKSNMTVYPKQKVTLKITGTKKKVKWSSKKASIVKVNKKGRVTAVKSGTTTITAKVGKKKYKCTVTVMTKGKIKKKLTKVYNYLDTFYSESTNMNSISSVEASIKTVNTMQKKHTTFINSLSGKKYKSYQKSYAKVMKQLSIMSTILSDWKNYLASPSYEEYSDEYDKIMEKYEKCLMDLWSAKLDLSSGMYNL